MLVIIVQLTWAASHSNYLYRLTALDASAAIAEKFPPEAITERLLGIILSAAKVRAIRKSQSACLTHLFIK